MRVTRKVRVVVRRHELEDILCNRCGESCRLPSGNYNATPLIARGSYDSSFPPDLSSWTLHLCEICLAWLVAGCKIPPKVAAGMGGGESTDTMIRALVHGETFHLNESGREAIQRVRDKAHVGVSLAAAETRFGRRHMWCRKRRTADGLTPELVERYLVTRQWTPVDTRGTWGQWRDDTQYIVRPENVLDFVHGYDVVRTIAKAEGVAPELIHAAMLPAESGPWDAE